MSADTNYFESHCVVTFTRSGSLSHSAALTTSATSDHQYDFLKFLGIAQSLNIDFLPIMWQPELDRAGRGGTAEILQTMIMLQTSYAFKRLVHSLPANKSNDFKALMAEVAVLGHPSVRGHSHIVRLEGICWDIDSETGEVWPVLVFGKAQHGDLMTFLELGEGKMLSLKDRLELCIDIVTGVMDMHLNSIIHGDIKPQNVLIYSNGCGGYLAKIADFGYSTIFADKDAVISMPGSPYWVAPEWHPRNYTTDVIGAKKMDAYSFGALCLWLIFYNNHENTSSNFYDDLRSKTLTSILVSDHLTGAIELDSQSRNILDEIFNRTLQQDAKDRTSDFTELFSLLSKLRAKNRQVPTVMVPAIGLPSGIFQVVPSMAHLLLADFRVRIYIAECLRKSVFEVSSTLRSQSFALELAFCYKVGFGVAKDEEISNSLLLRSGYHSEELDRRISSIREGPGAPQFRESAYCLFVERGYDLMVDFNENYRTDQEIGVAISQYKRETVDLEDVLGPEHLLTQILKTRLCTILRGAGYQREAGELREQITETLKKVQGDNHPDTLSSMVNLAAIYTDQGRWKEAEEIQAQVLKTQTSLLGTEHPNTLESLGVLSTIYRSQGRLEQAKELQLQAVHTREAILGQEHPDTLRSKASLAAIYLEQRQLDEAEQLLVSVLRTRKAILGEKHADTLSSEGNLATCYYYQKRLFESEELRSQIVILKEEVLGKDHPDTFTSISNLASTRKELGWLEESEALEEQLVGARSRVLGKDHPSTLTTLGNLAFTYGLQERWEKAVDLGKTVVDLKGRVLEQNHPSTIASMINLADAYKGLGQLQEAERLLVLAVRNSVAALGTEHPTSMAVMSHLISLYQEQGKWKESDGLEA